MRYISTRGQAPALAFEDVVLTGLAPDGGLYVPENLPKFTLQFSAPMRRGESYEHIRLLDSQDREVELPFLELEQELWDRTGTRLTLFLHPGRIKRGLRPNAELGPPLREGESYTLRVAERWLDGRGEPLVDRFDKQFQVGSPDRSSPSPADWSLTTPPAGGREPVTVHFPAPLDRVLLERVMRVIRRGEEVAGEVEIGKEERSWSLVPLTPWLPGEYGIEAELILEDLAGNNLRGLFDIELGADAPEHGAKGPVRIPFVVR